MARRGKIVFGLMIILLLAVSVAGCDKIGKTGKKDKDTSEFKRGPEGLVMEFVPNYPQDKFIVSKPKPGEEGERISILVEVRNKGTYYAKTSANSEELEKGFFGFGKIHLSGFDPSIIKMNQNSKPLSDLFLPPASSVNPLGGIDTAEFDGIIAADNILIDSYNPTILVTACYPYFTKSTPTVCIDPEPFDTRQEKVCNIGSQTVSAQGAPVAVTKIEQEAAARKIQFKISIKNVGDGDVIWDKNGITGLGGDTGLLNRCNPNAGGKLDRKDFDRVQLERVKIGDIDLLKDGKCAPFADDTKDTTHLIRLFDGGGFVICTYDVPDNVQSAYTTPIDIELRYAYRSTISKPIQIKKLETIS